MTSGIDSTVNTGLLLKNAIAIKSNSVPRILEANAVRAMINTKIQNFVEAVVRPTIKYKIMMVNTIYR